MANRREALYPTIAQASKMSIQELFDRGIIALPTATHGTPDSRQS